LRSEFVAERETRSKNLERSVFGIIGEPSASDLGASGARIMTTLVNALEQRAGRYGLQTMCEGGGMANATIIERLD
jgi:acetyl-CoA acetyltransferase